jgi:D-alanine-D-alanine ligase
MVRRWRQPVLVEAFIPFGELTVCLIGNPPTAYPAIQRPIDPASRLSMHVVPGAEAWEAPVDLTPEIEASAGRIALTMFDALGCRDMARVDLRVDGDGRAQFLEINPLPTFDPDGSLGLLAEHLGLRYPAMIGRILDAATARLAASRNLAPHR